MTKLTIFDLQALRLHIAYGLTMWKAETEIHGKVRFELLL